MSDEHGQRPWVPAAPAVGYAMLKLGSRSLTIHDMTARNRGARRQNVWNCFPIAASTRAAIFPLRSPGQTD
jgi:hypothetical protein